ncbi:FMN-binding negative transcriptional regulator [Allohahella marinimesophila]|uniref:FMN-binding negative transcriptional regulator n=1 Tax=Allohahella marinimesophila TaxID=1054972 RepID=A0ABP7NEZ3_9GAMM
MYVPKHFDNSTESEVRALVRSYPLAALVIMDQDQVLSANHIPFVFESDHIALASDGAVLSRGELPGLLQDRLQGHIPRANKLWQDHSADVEVLLIFQGAQGYISPNWYPSKQESGRVVPTWNYEAVHIRGRLRVVDDASWVLRQMTTMTQLAEMDSSPAWQVSDAPADYIQKLSGVLLGIEVEITHVEAKSKMSQNQPDANRAGVLSGLARLGTPHGQVLAEAIRRRS